MAALGRDHYAGVKFEGCHRQVTVKAGDRMEEVTVMAVSTVFP